MRYKFLRMMEIDYQVSSQDCAEGFAMAIAVQWDNLEHTVVRWDFDRDWTWEEFADSARVSSAMMASMDARIDVILNVTNCRPPQRSMTRYHRSAVGYVPANVGSLVLVQGTNERAAEIVAPFFNPLVVVDSLDEARARLQAQPA